MTKIEVLTLATVPFVTDQSNTFGDLDEMQEYFIRVVETIDSDWSGFSKFMSGGILKTPGRVCCA